MSGENVARKLSRREELGVESRRRIVDAAAELMAERGFAGTSIAAVSKRSGLPSGSIYWHFESKEALLAVVMEEGARRWFDALPGPEALPPGPEDRVSPLLDSVLGSLEQHPEFLRLLVLISLERREVDAASLAVVRRVREMALDLIRRQLSRVFESLGPEVAERLADQFASFVLCVVDGAFVAHHVDPDPAKLRRLFDVMRHALAALAREVVSSGGGAGR